MQRRKRLKQAFFCVCSTIWCDKTILYRKNNQFSQYTFHWNVENSHHELQWTFGCIFVRKIIIFLSVLLSWRHEIRKHEKMKARFNRSILPINVQKIYFRTKLMLLYNFVNYFCPTSLSVLETGLLTLQSSTRRHRMTFLSIVHVYFTIDRYNFYEYSSSRSKLKKMANNFTIITYMKFLFKNV